VNAKELDLRKSGTPRSEDEIQSLAKSNTDQSFDKDCIAPMKKVDSCIPCVRVSGEDLSRPLHWPLSDGQIQ
jgi:hypothetical protein